MERVRVLDPTYENETGIIQYVSSNEGYPIAKIKLDSTESVSSASWKKLRLLNNV